MTIEDKIKDKIKYIRTVEELEIIRQKLNEVEDKCNYDDYVKREIQKTKQEMINLINNIDDIIFR